MSFGEAHRVVPGPSVGPQRMKGAAAMRVAPRAHRGERAATVLVALAPRPSEKGERGLHSPHGKGHC